MEENKNSLKPQIVNVYNRTKIDIFGVLEVVSSSEKEVYAKLDDCYLQILGEGMTVTKLIPYEKLLTINGKINGMLYSKKQAKKSLLGKVFK